MAELSASRSVSGLLPAASALAALSAGFAVCMNVVHYRTWTKVPADAFGAFQTTSAEHTVPAAALLGLSALAANALAARRATPGVARGWLWLALVLGAVPWISTPAMFVGMQADLAASGPTSAAVGKLVVLDLLLRTVPPTLQAAILLTALHRAMKVLSGTQDQPAGTR